MYLNISNMFRTLICAVSSTTINKLSMYILLSDIIRNLHFPVRTLPGSLNRQMRDSAELIRGVLELRTLLRGRKRMSCNRVYPLSVDEQPFASPTATASVSAGNAAELLWCQKSARTITPKEFNIARRARHCTYVLIHCHSVTHS